MTTIEFKFVVHSSEGEHAEISSVPDGSAMIGGDADHTVESHFHLLAKSMDRVRAFLDRVAPVHRKCGEKATICNCMETEPNVRPV